MEKYPQTREHYLYGICQDHIRRPAAMIGGVAGLALWSTLYQGQTPVEELNALESLVTENPWTTALMCIGAGSKTYARVGEYVGFAIDEAHDFTSKLCNRLRGE